MKHLTKHQFWIVPSLLILDSIFFGTTNPSKVASIFLIIGFLLAAVTLFSILRLASKTLGVYGIPRAYTNRLADVLTVVGAVLLALSSVGELTSRDTTVMLLLGAIFYVYMSYVKTRKI